MVIEQLTQRTKTHCRYNLYHIHANEHPISAPPPHTRYKTESVELAHFYS